jgi:hypothetical protein
MRGQSFVVWSWYTPFRPVYKSWGVTGPITSGYSRTGFVPQTGPIPDSRTSRTVYCPGPLHPRASVSRGLPRASLPNLDRIPLPRFPVALCSRVSSDGCLFSCQNRGLTPACALPSHQALAFRRPDVQVLSSLSADSRNIPTGYRLVCVALLCHSQRCLPGLRSLPGYTHLPVGVPTPSCALRSTARRAVKCTHRQPPPPRFFPPPPLWFQGVSSARTRKSRPRYGARHPTERGASQDPRPKATPVYGMAASRGD